MKQPTVRIFSRKQISIGLLGIAIGLVFTWLAFRQVDWDSVTQALGSATWAGIGIALLLKVGSDFVRAIRWRYLWTGHKVSSVRLYVVETAAVGLNNVSPVHVLDEPLILGLLTLRDRLPAGAVLTTMLMARVQDLVFTVMFAVLALGFMPQVFDMAWPLAFAIIALIALLVVILNIRWLVGRFPRIARIPAIVELQSGVDDLKRRPRRLGLTFCLTVAYWCMLGPAAVALGHGMGIQIPLHEMTMVVLGAIFFGTAIPSLPGGFGTFEFAVIAILGLWNVDRDTALAFALLLHLMLFAPSTLVSIIVLPREGIGTLKSLRELVARVRKPAEVPAGVGQGAQSDTMAD